MVFFGEYHVNITRGGRIVIPKKIRENLSGDSFVLTKGHGSCLSGFSLLEWQKKTDGVLASDSLLDNQNIDKKRLIFSTAHFVSIDDQGRCVLPKKLLDIINSNSNQLSFIGVGDHFEIWAIQTWIEYQINLTL